MSFDQYDMKGMCEFQKVKNFLHQMQVIHSLLALVPLILHMAACLIVLYISECIEV
jgi:hypothetical protein